MNTFDGSPVECSRKGLANDDAVDESRLPLGALRQLEPVHLRVFGELAASVVVTEAGTPVQRPLTLAELGTAWPEGRSVLPGVLAVLESAGLIRFGMFSPDELRNPERYAPHTDQLPPGNAEGWTPTTYGDRLQRFVDGRTQ